MPLRMTRGIVVPVVTVVVERDVGCQLEILAFVVFAIIDHIRQVGKLLGIVDKIRVVIAARAAAKLAVRFAWWITPRVCRKAYTLPAINSRTRLIMISCNFVFIIYLFLNLLFWRQSYEKKLEVVGQ